MSPASDVREFKPGRAFRERDEATYYWIRDGKILYRDYPLRGADIPSFRFYLGGFAKDRKNCYCTSSRLTGGIASAFRALNYCYVSDGRSVWTMGGKIKEADAESFVACDDGVRELHSGSRVPYGFGRDRHRVYYYDHCGKAKRVRKADPASFRSLNDGFYARDHNFVFCGASVLAGATVEHWRKLDGHYSRDARHVFYDRRRISAADQNSFEVVCAESGLQLARDKNHFYWNDDVVNADAFEELLSEKAD